MAKFKGLVRGALLVVAALAISTAAAAPGPYQVKSIRAFLYYPGTGTFDTRDLVAGKVGLFNTVIGEGGAQGPSSTTLVLVDLTGPSFASLRAGNIELLAVAGGKTLLKQKLQLGEFFSEKKQVTVPFVVHETGCSPLKLTATLTSPSGQTASKTATVDFQCGE